MSTYTPGHDSTVMKVESRTAPKGPHGERYLASGRSLGMRLFDSLGPTSGEEMHSRPYEYAGYVLSGKGQLLVGGQPLDLVQGASYCVPAGVQHTYRISEGPFSAVEACSPLPWVHDRDKPVDQLPAAQRSGNPNPLPAVGRA